MYDYKAKLVRWHDGDTALMVIDLGFGAGMTTWIRLVDCWAPEMSTPQGQPTLDAARLLVPDGTDCFVITRKLDDKQWFEGKQLPQTFARYLGTVYPLNPMKGGAVNDILVKTGYATRTRNE